MFVKKPRVARKSILRISEGTSDSPTLPTDLSALRDEVTRRLLTSPSEMITKLEKLETTALSPDLTIPLGAPFPWLGHVYPVPHLLGTNVDRPDHPGHLPQGPSPHPKS